jgi:hypothetical protein
MWKHDPKALGPYLSVESSLVEAKQKGFGIPAARHLKVTAGNQDGDGILFACITRGIRGRPYAYDVMGKRNMRNCEKPIKISVKGSRKSEADSISKVVNGESKSTNVEKETSKVEQET